MVRDSIARAVTAWPSRHADGPHQALICAPALVLVYDGGKTRYGIEGSAWGSTGL